MLQKIKKLFFLLFTRLVPPHFLEEALKKEKVKLNAQQCTLKQKAILLPDARILNFQNNPLNIVIGESSVVRGELLINAYGGKISIGDFSSVGEHSRIWSASEVAIGNNVHISHGVNIIDGNTHSLDPIERGNEFKEILEKGKILNKGNIGTKQIIIEDDVWISFNATILKGVTIGKGAVIAANSLVVKNVAAHTMVGGTPAVKIKDINTNKDY